MVSPPPPALQPVSLFDRDLELVKRKLKPRWKFGDLQLKQPQTLEGFASETSPGFGNNVLEFELAGDAMGALDVG